MVSCETPPARHCSVSDSAESAGLVNQGRFSVPRLSIIIPVLGSLDRSLRASELTPTDSHNPPASPDVDRLETTLVSVLQNRPPDCEILVVHNAPYDDAYDLAAEVRFLPVDRGLGLVESLNHAIRASHGAFIHVLSTGLEVTEGWTDAALAHFQDGHVASVAPLIADALDTGQTRAAGLTYSCRRGRGLGGDVRQTIGPASDGHQVLPSEILGPLVQASFFRRAALEVIGGLPTVVGDALADVDLALALRFAGYRSVLEPRSIILTTETFRASPPPGFRYGLAAERLFWRAAPIVGWSKSLIAHPWGILADFIRAFPRPTAFSMLLGRLLGACQIGSHRAYHRWLREIRQTAAPLPQTDRATRVRFDEPHLTASRTISRSVGASSESAVSGG